MPMLSSTRYKGHVIKVYISGAGDKSFTIKGKLAGEWKIDPEVTDNYQVDALVTAKHMVDVAKAVEARTKKSAAGHQTYASRKALPHGRCLRRTPLKRSTKPISKLGRRGKLRKVGMDAARAMYGEGPCQLCQRSNLVLCPHHKTKRSDRGKENPENMVMVCWGNPRACHELIHRSDNVALFERVKASTANVQNKEMIL